MFCIIFTIPIDLNVSRYDEAFESVKAHTGDAELRAFWAPFGVDFKSPQSQLRLRGNNDGGPPTQDITSATTNETDNGLGGGWNMFPAQVNDAAISMHGVKKHANHRHTINPLLAAAQDATSKPALSCSTSSKAIVEGESGEDDGDRTHMTAVL